MDRILAAGGLLVQEADLARSAIDAEGTDFPRIAVDAVQEALLGIEGEKRRIDQILEELDMGPGAGRGVYPVDVDPSPRALRSLVVRQPT